MKALRLTITLLFSFIFTTSLIAGNYTWTGTTDTDWGTSTNWSPNGIPDSGDTISISTTANAPVLDQARTITQIAMNSGTLDLNTYTLSFTGKGLFYGGTITNGKIYSSSGVIAHYVGTTMDCKVSTITTSISLRWTEFMDSTRIERTGSGTIATIGGNKYQDYAEIVNSGSGVLRLSDTSPYDEDSAFADIKFVDVDGIAYRGTDHYFGGKVTVEISSSGITYIARYGTATFADDIDIDASNAGAKVYFGTDAGTGNNQLNAGGQISHVGSNVSWLNLDRFTYAGKAVIDWPASVFINDDAVFEDTVDVEAPAIVLNGGWFKDTTSLKMETGSAAEGSGGNRFDGATSIYVYASELQSANTYPDTFNNTLWLYCLGGDITLARGCTGTYFDGDIKLKGKGGDLSLGAGASSGSTLASGYTVSIDTFNTDDLSFRGFVQAGTEENTLELTGDAGTYFSHDATFNGKFNLTTPSLYLNGGIFNDTTIIEKTGAGILNQCSGGNHFNAPLTFTHDGATRMAVYQPDTFAAPVTFIHTNAQLYLSYGTGSYFGDDATFKVTGSSNTLYASYTGTNTFAGNIYVANASSSSSINFGASTGTSTLASGKTIIEHADSFNTGSLLLTSFTKNGTAPVNLDFGTEGKLTFGSNGTFDGNISYKGGSFYLNGCTFNNDVSLIKMGGANDASSGGNTFNAELSIIDSASGAILLCNSSDDDYNGNVSFTTASTGTFEANRLADGYYAADLTINGSADVDFGYYSSGSNTIFDGAGNQTVSGTASGDFMKIKVNKSDGNVILQKDVTITDTLKLVDGLIEADTNTVTLNDNSIVTGVADTAYVQGYVKKVGDDAFTYPIGRDGYYRPLSISAPSSSNAEFVSNYYKENPIWAYGFVSEDTTFNEISRSEFWSLERTSSNDTVFVTLSWDTLTSCSLDSLDSLVVVSWVDTTWKDLGNGGTTGDTISGTIISDTTASYYDVFTLGTKNEFECREDDEYCATGVATDEPGVVKAFDCDHNGTDYTSKYRTPGYWVEDTLSIPIKTIRVNWVVCRDDQGGNGWQDVQAFRDQIDTIMAWSNYHYANSLPKGYLLSCEPTIPFYIGDTRIRFELQDIIFLDNTNFNQIGFTGQVNQGGPVINYLHANYPGSEDCFNFICTNPDPNPNSGATWSAYYDTFNGHGYIHNREIMEDTDTIYGAYLWNLYSNFIHEFGHALGLHHTYNAEYTNINHFDFLDDIFGLCPQSVCTFCTVPSGFVCHFDQNCPIFMSEDQNPTPLMSNAWYLRYISPKSIGRMHRALSLFDRIFRVDNRPMHQYVKEDSSYSVSKEISENETWDFAIKMYQNIVVKSGNTLTIQCEVRMPEDGKIIVEQGARLVVDGGTLTAAHDLWDGVQVWGYPNLPQGTLQNTLQGVVEVINNGVIENARIGILVADAEGSNTKTGGIVYAENGIFQNNRKDVAFMQYRAAKSLSQFINCQFLTDQPMQGTEYYVGGRYLGSNAHVTIWDVGKVTFESCTFTNTIDYVLDGQPDSFDADIRGEGIVSVDADVVITSNEASPTIGDGCTFQNLTQGVRKLNTYIGMFPQKHTVTYNTFENCVFGINMEATYGDLIEYNDFQVPATEGHPFLGYTWGTFLYKSLHVKAARNLYGLYNPQSQTPTTLNGGAITDGYLFSGNYIKDNQFDDLWVATDAEGTNPYAKILCNDYENSDYDWVINDGYLAPQGTGCEVTSYRAGNTFDHQNIHIHSTTANNWTYWAKGQDNPSGPYTLVNFSNTGSGNRFDCDLANDDCPDDTEVKSFSQWKSEYVSLNDTAQDLSNEYSTVYSNLDSGNTSTLLSHLADDQYNMPNLKSELLGGSPLSDTVLMTLIIRDSTFNSADFQDIMLANSPVSRYVLDSLDVYIQNLTQAYQDTILGAQATDSVRTLTVLNRAMAAVASEKFEVEYNILYLYDEADSTVAMVEYMTDSIDTREYRKLAIGYCLELDTVEWAREIMDSLYLELDGDNDTAFYEYYDIVVDLAEDSLTWFDMTGTQHNKVIELAATDYEIAVNAQAVLSLVDDSLYLRFPDFPSRSQSRLAGDEEPVQDEQKLRRDIKVYPNPFENSFNVAYELQREADKLVIEVFDLLGRNVLTKQFNNTSIGNEILDLGSCQGVYLLRIVADDKVVYQTKLICSKP